MKIFLIGVVSTLTLLLIRISLVTRKKKDLLKRLNDFDQLLGESTRNKLIRAGLTLRQTYSMSRSDLLKVKGLGEKTVNKVILAKFGIQRD